MYNFKLYSENYINYIYFYFLSIQYTGLNGYDSVIVNFWGIICCGRIQYFILPGYQSDKMKIINISFSRVGIECSFFFALVLKLSAALSFATQNAM